MLARVYELMPLQCPHCAGEMKIIAFIKDQDSIQSILNHLNESTQAPQMMTARGPPEIMDEQLEINFEDDFVDIPYDNFDRRISW